MRLKQIKPKPHAVERADALPALGRFLSAAVDVDLVWLTDGVDLGGGSDFVAALGRLVGQRPLTVVQGGIAGARALTGADNAAGSLTVKVLRATSDAPETGTVRALDLKGLPLGDASFQFKGDERETEAELTLPVEIRNDIARLEIAGERSAGAVSLLDKRWRRRSVGVITGSTVDTAQPLLASTYYLTRALGPFADVRLADRGSPAQAEIFRLEGGNDRLVDALVRSLDRTPRLCHRLIAIAQSTDRIVATVIDRHGQQQQLEADAMVVTLPASALRDVTITPGLPDPQRRAISGLRYGQATKVLVQTTRDVFARRRARAFGTDDVYLGAFWDASEEQRHGASSMLAFLGGGSASAGLRNRVAQGVDHLMSALCWLGMAGADARAMRAATWEDDPWARGGYAYFDPGFDPALRPYLAQPAGRLAFAGEHTSARWQGYMNGAVESGIRAAHELIST